MTHAVGTVINIHHHGGTVRLDDGTLATIPIVELDSNRPAYASSLAKRTSLELSIDRRGRHRTAALADTTAPTRADVPTALVRDVDFEARIGAYLKTTQEWAPPDQAAPAERHFIRKKRRARLFEARGETT